MDVAITAQEKGAPAGGMTAVDAHATPYPPARQGWYCVFVLALAVMINFLDRGILTLLVEPIKHDLQLTDVEMSLVMGFAFTFFYAVLGFPVARLVDRSSRKYILSAGIAIWSAMTILCGLATSFFQLFVARMGLGVGETTSGPSAYSLMSDYFPPHRLPRAISVMQIGFVLGTGLAMILGAWIIDFVASHPAMSLPIVGRLHGWQMVLMLVSLPGIVVACLMLTVREPPRRGGKAEAAPLGEVFRLIGRHKLVYLPLFIGMGLRSSQMFGTQNWSPAFYGRTYGWSPSQVGYVTGFAVFVAMPLGIFLGNWLAEHYWKRGVHDANVRVVVISTLVSVPFGIAFPLMPDPWLAVGCALIAQVGSMMAAAPENAAVQTVTPNHLRGQVTFLFLFIMNVVGMGFGPLLVAGISQYVVGEAEIRYALALTGLIMGVPAILAFRRGQRPYGQAIATGQPLE
ncbi:MAG TPA: MFS transporter [Sphingomonadaceae bacterium]|nr:MFS transporter [Sphingomonadaceae bacterium]